MLNIWASQQQGNPVLIPDPIAVADFRGNSYSIGGVPKVLADLFTLSIFTGDDTNIAVITGEGFKCEYEGTASASGWLLATPELFAALTPAAGFTAVIDVSSTVGGGASDLGAIELTLGDSNTSLVATLQTFGGFGSAPHTDLNIVRSIAATPGSPEYTALASYSNGLHNLVISYDPAGLRGTADGNPVVVTAPFADQATADRLSIYVEAIFNALLIAERVRFYSLIVDDRVLRQLGAAPT